MTYTFDFEAEVARARSLFPEETKNITFMNIGHEPEQRNEITKNFVRLHEASGCTIDQELKFKLEVIALDLFMKARNGGGAYRKNGHSLLAMDTQKACLGLPIDKDVFIRFYHELGHLIAKGGTLHQNGLPKKYDTVLKNAAENVADTFALMVGVHLGVLDTTDIAFVAAMRSFRCMMYNDLVHLTAPNLYQLHDTALEGGLQNLTPRDIAASAFQYRLGGKLQLSAFEKIGAIYSPEVSHYAFTSDKTQLRAMTQEQRQALFDDIMLTRPAIAARNALHDDMKRNPGIGIVEAIVSNPVFCRTIRTYFMEKAARLAPNSNEYLFTCAAVRAAEWGLRQ